MSALIEPARRQTETTVPDAAAAQVRFGMTVSRHQARRAFVRNTVRRVLREAARHASEELIAAARTRCVDIVLRLKAPLPERSQASWSSVKAELRRQADGLLEELRRQLLREDARRATLGAERTGART